jgi:hypothetical protein
MATVTQAAGQEVSTTAVAVIPPVGANEAAAAHAPLILLPAVDLPLEEAADRAAAVLPSVVVDRPVVVEAAPGLAAEVTKQIIL